LARCDFDELDDGGKGKKNAVSVDEQFERVLGLEAAYSEARRELSSHLATLV
jgi:hypothetical protein